MTHEDLFRLLAGDPLDGAQQAQTRETFTVSLEGNRISCAIGAHDPARRPPLASMLDGRSGKFKTQREAEAVALGLSTYLRHYGHPCNSQGF